MAYQALYRKYRPKDFNDFIDQDVVKKILLNSIKNKKLSHAYLFAGPRGIGKTSMAKIFAKAVNCLDFDKKDDVCDECINCIECNNNSVDIVEIDAASNNGVDQIRDLKSKINIVPSNLKYKVYIIDEVHMLTNSAFNALLKTLEEPPSYIIFILATTEFYEVPETIVSRCQCFNFSRISIESLIKRLRYIADQEKINVDDNTLEEIAHFSNGGLRDAIGVLDKLNSFTNGNITLADFETINNLISHSDIVDSYNSIINCDNKKILDVLNKINKNGYNFNNYIDQLMVYVRDIIVDNTINKKIFDLKTNVLIVNVLNKLSDDLKHTLNPYVITQVTLLDLIENISREINDAENKEVISREIKTVDNVNSKSVKESEIDNDKIISQEIIDNKINKPKTAKSVENKLVINQEVRDILINNSLASANKNKKEEYTNLWNNLSEYFNVKKYAKASQLLFDTVPMVVGIGFMILTSDTNAIIENIYKNINLCEELINKITNDNIRIVIVLNNEFEKIKTKYINDLTNGVKYKVIDESRDLVTLKNTDLVSKAIDIFGKDLVDVE